MQRVFYLSFDWIFFTSLVGSIGGLLPSWALILPACCSWIASGLYYPSSLLAASLFQELVSLHQFS